MKQDETKTDEDEVTAEQLAQLLGGIESDDEPDVADEGSAGKPNDRSELVARLKSCAARFTIRHTFQKGQLVRWKKHMRNKNIPEYGAPAVVIDVLDQPVFDGTEHSRSGGPYFREPLDLVVGLYDKDGDLVCYHLDSRRMEPYPG